MNGIAITSDSTCDLSVQQIRENEIGHHAFERDAGR